MRDGEGGASLHESARGFFEQGFGFGVETGGGFVEDQDGRVFEEGACVGESLRLSAGEARSAFADDCFIFLWKRFDELMQARRLCRRDDLFIGRFGVAEFDVGGERVVEEVRALRNPGD